MKWRSVVAPVGVLCFLALLWCWYMAAADYSYSWLAGTYEYRSATVASKVVLRQDGTFEQQRAIGAEVKSVSGRWRRVGEGGVVFSKEFLNIPYEESREDGQVDGTVTKRFLGFFPKIVLSNNSGGPLFNRKLF